MENLLFEDESWYIEEHDSSDKYFNVGPVTIDYDDVDPEEQDAIAFLVSQSARMYFTLQRILDKEQVPDEEIRKILAKARGEIK